jgi:hypothetical protein
MISRFIPDVSEKDVQRVLYRDYHLDQIEYINTLVSLYNLSDRPRLVLACFKNAKGDFKTLCNYLFHAQDYCMEYMASAESPSCLKIENFESLAQAKRQELTDLDQKLYYEWLRS